MYFLLESNLGIGYESFNRERNDMLERFCTTAMQVKTVWQKEYTYSGDSD